MINEKALEKSKAVFEKLTLDEAIETYHELGKSIHEKIEAKKQEAEQQLQKLKREA